VFLKIDTRSESTILCKTNPIKCEVQNFLNQLITQTEKPISRHKSRLNPDHISKQNKTKTKI